MRWLALCLGLAAATAAAEERPVRLEAPAALAATGIFDYVLPRFSLKTQVRVELAAPGDLALVAGAARPVFAWDGRNWGLAPPAPEGGAGRLADWLRSEVGLRTLLAFEGADLAAPERVVAAAPVAVDAEAAAAGDALAHRHCGRCHVVSARNRMGGIGSTPSFAAMKNYPDWEARFAAFYAAAPHPAFTQIDGLTEPFDPLRPPPIAPLEMSFEDYEAILAYLRSVPVKDLGAPVVAR